MKWAASATLLLALLAVGCTKVDVHGDDPGTATQLGMGDSVKGQIVHRPRDDEYDSDWFAFAAQANQSYMFVLTSSALFQRALKVYDPDLSPVPGTDFLFPDHFSFSLSERNSVPSRGPWYDRDCSFPLCRFPWTAQVTGTHYLEIDGLSGQGLIFVSEGNYALTGTIYDDDYQNILEGATPVAVNSSIHGTIEITGDQDWFTFDAVEGRTYEFAVEGDASNLFVDVVQAREWTEDYINLYLQAEPISNYVWTAHDSKAYYIVVTGKGNRTSNYTLSVSTRDGHG